jgi:hypothetical protein
MTIPVPINYDVEIASSLVLLTMTNIYYVIASPRVGG